MTEKELFEKNQKLSTEFDLYLLDHPELLDKIPENALIVLSGFRSCFTGWRKSARISTLKTSLSSLFPFYFLL
ncbi:hypothetical protein HKBW3S42_00861 [Candidatus Hakubella thermalkaliphila]|uniref:Uncharacterized protein n=1 Tax=Candidatus Hakubella thermalkaliphila TaxID=2754717 RepID=A0A6V8NHQ0_9ACTN|nr:DUF5647 family protein [Candidatus Hakubella thermalkaliphila]GFP19733.1 hypothetical protein HKBW3S03_01237 [Candidatus Hakubella thermalkaliphila]GFP30880.1 hypothetical protein HKBW3S34_01799 [Candidatus Hakubella thermalkaliphila]GFP32557.1 hypothetical protein HKBW3S42_00861 [Candidatus Hakubella thermalkaliphila]GFP40171.1 hypothetical protein HKBW3S47_01868 [Candidatus Hakubella thermalkaliphila]GFP41297.1 hypothetical protein HKBW3C_00423 [Candidatus Hakubella thermalkaliphila]